MKLLIAHRQRYSDEQYDRLRALGFDLCIMSRETDPVPASGYDAEAVVCYQLFNFSDISLFPKLRVIHTTSAGLDHMPLDAIRRRGITLYNAGGVYSAPMAEFALCGVLQLYKHAPKLARQQREHVWKQDFRLLELAGKRVCIVGAGSIGTECAKRFSAMGCHVTGLCRRPADKPYFDAVRHIDELDELLPLSDVVIACLPLTEETRGLFGAARFEKMKPGAVLVNIARGPVVDTGALLCALDAGRLLGAVIDVCETEPLPPDSPLWDRDDLILTPHISFVGDGNADRMFELIYCNFHAYLGLD